MKSTPRIDYKPSGSTFKEINDEKRKILEKEIKSIQRQIDIIKNIKPYKKLRFIDDSIEYEDRYFRNIDSRWTLIENIKQLIDNAKKQKMNYNDISIGIDVLKNTTYKNDSKWLSAISQIMDDLPPEYDCSEKKSVTFNLSL
jgi:hypothetical protein